MQIQLNQLGKRYSRKWIFKHITSLIDTGSICAIRGRNGSGKSTLLQIISGYLSPSEGELLWSENGINIPRSELYKKISFSAPYMDLIESFSLDEMIKHHLKFKAMVDSLDQSQISVILGLENHKKKYIADFSSGMMQRVKLGFALLSDVQLILLDEPGNTLDKEGKEWFQNLLKKYKRDRTVIIASNLEEDLTQCIKSIQMEEFK